MTIKEVSLKFDKPEIARYYSAYTEIPSGYKVIDYRIARHGELWLFKCDAKLNLKLPVINGIKPDHTWPSITSVLILEKCNNVNDYLLEE